MYLIWNSINRLWWSNSCGWVESEADIFNTEERNTLNLPVDGIWYNLTTGELEINS